MMQAAKILESVKNETRTSLLKKHGNAKHLATHALALLGPSDTSDSVLDIDVLGADFIFSRQKRSLYSYENYMLQVGFSRSHTFLHAAKNNSVYLGSNIAWEGKSLFFNGRVYAEKLHVILAGNLKIHENAYFRTTNTAQLQAANIIYCGKANVTGDFILSASNNLDTSANSEIRGNKGSAYLIQ